MLQESAIAPVRGTSPKEGLRPVHPHRVDGEEIEPSVSEPTLKATHPAAVAEAGPADEPLDPCLVFQGLRVTPPNHTSPCASAPSVNFATSTAPALSKRFTTVASSSIIWVSNPAAPQVVRMPFVASKSLAPHGNPCKGPRCFPAATSRSASMACARAKSSRFFGTPDGPILGALEMRTGFRSVSNFIPGNTGSKISAGSTELGMCSL